MKRSETCKRKEKRGSCASRYNECCIDPAVVEHFTTMGAALAWQQLALIQGDISRAKGGQQQPAPATLVHVLEGVRSMRRKMRRSRQEERRVVKWVNQRWWESVMMDFRVLCF